MMHMLGEVKGLLTALLGRMDGLEQRMRIDMDAVNKRLDDVSTRVSTLEATNHRTAGMATAARIVVPAVWGLVLSFGGVVLWLMSHGLIDLIAASTKK